MEFKRFNPFKGLFTHAEDWQAAGSYHRNKQQLHNRYLHGAGIVTGYLDNLDVAVSGEGTSLSVSAGLAVDQEGRELHLDGSTSVSIEPQAFPTGAVVYLALVYEEEQIDRRENTTNPQYTGYAFVHEMARLELTTTDPRESGAVELARIRLGGGATRIRMPINPDEPGENEVDSRFRQRAGVARGRWRIHDFADRVNGGRVSIPAKAEGPTIVRIEEVTGGDAHRFYSVSCYPLGEAWIGWKTTASKDRRGAVEYSLYIESYSEKDVDVDWEIYRIG
jgi:hypothetical protein